MRRVSASGRDGSPSRPQSVHCRRRAISAVALALLTLATAAFAEDKKDAPRVTAVAPLEIVPGVNGFVKIRGVKLSAASEVRFPDNPVIKAEIKEKKAAEVPNGLDAKDVGDTQIEVALTVPADLAPGKIAFVVTTPDGPVSASLLVREAATLVSEKEPNNGFAEAQPVELGRTITGSVKEDKDVDVFQFNGHAKQHVLAEVSANCCGSLLDAVLTLFDARGHILATCDDIGGNHDPQLHADLPADGVYFLALYDAHDRGGAWHPYELTVKEVAP